jgi:hypothetical protein
VLFAAIGPSSSLTLRTDMKRMMLMMTNRLCVPENQIGFIRVMVLPLYKAWAEVFPTCAPLLNQVFSQIYERNALVGNIYIANNLLVSLELCCHDNFLSSFIRLLTLNSMSCQH